MAIETHISLRVVVRDGTSEAPLGDFNFPASMENIANCRNDVFSIPSVGHILGHKGLRFRVTAVEWTLIDAGFRTSKPHTLYVEPLYEGV